MHFRSAIYAGALCLAAAGPWSSSARAEKIQASYTLMLSASDARLDAPNDAMAAMMAAWQPAHVLLVQRSMPFVEITNTSDGANITRLTMSIGDESKNFDWARLIESSSGVGVSVNVPDELDGGQSANLVELAFSDFEPGDSVRFQVQIRPDSAEHMQYPDYRTVLFQLNGGNPQNNSLVEVTLADPISGAEVTLSERLPDYPVFGFTQVGPGFRPYDVMDMVSIFPLSSAPATIIIPEPSSYALSLIAAAFFLLLIRKPRK